MLNYLDDLFVVRDILSKEKVVLFLSDTVWCLIGDAFSIHASKKILDLTHNNNAKNTFLLVDSLEAIHELSNNLHPRIETLLHFHNRPINIIYKARPSVPSHLTWNGQLTIRYTKDPLLSDLVKLLGNPILSCPARTPNFKNVQDLNLIDPVIKENVDHIFFLGKKTDTKNKEATLVSFDKNGELLFLRK